MVLSFWNNLLVADLELGWLCRPSAAALAGRDVCKHIFCATSAVDPLSKKSWHTSKTAKQRIPNITNDDSLL
jgi:hypothetical protein